MNDLKPIEIFITVTEDHKRASVIVECKEPLTEDDFLKGIEEFLKEKHTLNFNNVVEILEDSELPEDVH